MAETKHTGEPRAKKLTPDRMVAKAYADLEVDHDDIYELQAKIDRLEAEKAELLKWAKWAYRELTEAWDEELPSEFTAVLDKAEPQ